MDTTDLYLARRKETQNALLLCLAVGLGIAFAARVPLFIVSLPLTWLAGGVSIAFLWVAGPPVMWFLQTMAFNALFESERTRRLALTLAHKPSGPWHAPLVDSGAIGIADATTAGLQRLLSRGTPPALFVLHGLLWLVPVIVNVVLLGSYLQFVRPNAANTRVFNSRLGQGADALLGIGGWGWIKPLAPSLQDNLGHLATQAERAKNKESAEKYELVRDQIPYVFFPLQAWLYVAGIIFGLDLSIRALQIECGADSPDGLTILLAASRNWLKERRAGKG